MLKVQEYLRIGGTVEQLSNDLGIKVTRHPVDPIFILNYSQIDSPKTNEIVRETRGLVLEDGSFDVIARSFNRFYNWGEVADEMLLFNWNDFVAQDKLDGSLMLLYNYKGTWRVNTKGSFGFGEVNSCGKTWTELFHEIIPYNVVENVCVEGATYVFEYCSVYNKVVIKYEKPQLYLLTIFDNEEGSEFQYSTQEYVAKNLGCNRPQLFSFKSLNDITEYVNSTKDDSQPSTLYEGFVVCDNENRRWKIKSPRYLTLHKMRGEGDNLFHPRYLLPWVLANEGDELLIYYGEVGEAYNEMKIVVDNARENLLELWDEVKEIPSQRDFAEAVLPRTKFSSLLFQARAKNLDPKDLWLQSEGLILKVLYNK